MRKLEIVVPTYNRPQKLYCLMKSAFNLNISDIYFTVIDDGSTAVEEVFNLGKISTSEVCEWFGTDKVRYIRLLFNQGLAAALDLYYKEYCESLYTLLVTDKDEFIDGSAIRSALSKLDNDNSLCMVQIPLRDIESSEQQKREWSFSYSRMSSSEFVNQYVRDINLQHCGMYSIQRVSAIQKAGLPHILGLQKYGLSDGFGFDTYFLLTLATMGDVDFETVPHVRRDVSGGATEQSPLSFAYCYYQYVKKIMWELRKKNIISRHAKKIYIKWWNLLILRGLVVIHEPSKFRKEKDTAQIHRHLKFPILLYLLCQYIQYQIFPTKEMKNLIKTYFKIKLKSFRNKLYSKQKIA